MRLPVLLIPLILAGCEGDPSQPRLEFLPEMVDSVPYDAFAPNPITRDGKTLIAPAPGTVPRGWKPLHYGPGPEEALRAGRELISPIPSSTAARARGGEAFQIFCQPCHGPSGQGDGLVVPKFPAPPPLTAAHAKGLPDGQIFHIISRGQGLMPSHATQVAPDDRWKIIQHIRVLQQKPAEGAKP